MESTSLRAIREKAEAYDKTLRADDPRFQREVTIIHCDGSVVHWDSAFLMKVKDETPVPWALEETERFWIVCFTEHHGMHIDHSDDVLRYWESKKIYDPLEEIPNGV